MRAYHGSLKVAKSCSSGKLSLIGNSLEGGVWNTREMIDDDIFDIFFISNFEIKLLEEEDPTNELGLRIFFEH